MSGRIEVAVSLLHGESTRQTWPLSPPSRREKQYKFEPAPSERVHVVFRLGGELTTVSLLRVNFVLDIPQFDLGVEME